MKYASPGIYSESVRNTSKSNFTEIVSSIGGFVGVSVRGKLNTPVLVTSWQNFLDNFAYGVDTPFIADSYLAYSVYGFFQNGGTKCYIIRTASKSATKASAEISGTTVSAKDEGTWGNNLKVVVTANEDTPANFDITVKYGKDTVEVFKNVSNTTTDSNYFIGVLEGSKFISCLTGTLSVTAETALSGGTDGVTDMEDSDYTNALKKFDTVEDISLICMPGQVSTTMTQALVDYVDKRNNMYAILDGAESATNDTIKTFRKTLTGKNAALYHPWIKVSDPLSKTGKLKSCPTCGHIMGMYARTIENRGVWKAPAGTEATVIGAVETVRALVKDDCDVLNPAGVNAVLPKSNYGIVVWGARSICTTDDDMKYVSDVLLDMHIRKTLTKSTEFAVFEPNNNSLWGRVKAICEAFLDSLWRAGGLKGEESSEAYFVNCGADINNDEVIKEGKLLIDIGYAGTKPAEFVVFRISHTISNE